MPSSQSLLSEKPLCNYRGNCRTSPVLFLGSRVQPHPARERHMLLAAVSAPKAIRTYSSQDVAASFWVTSLTHSTDQGTGLMLLWPPCRSCVVHRVHNIIAKRAKSRALPALQSAAGARCRIRHSPRDSSNCSFRQANHPLQ